VDSIEIEIIQNHTNFRHHGLPGKINYHTIVIKICK